MEAYNSKAYWFSKINDSRTCLAYYKAKHIDGVVQESKSLDSEFGTALHLGINEILQGGDGEEIFKLYWDSVEGQDLKRFKFDWRCLKFNGEVFLSRFKRLHAKHFVPHKMEERIFTKYGPHLVEGTPDYLGDYKGIPSIVDFKTASSKYDASKIECEEQLSLYADMAVKELGYEPKQRVYMVFVKDFKEPSIQILKSELTSVVRSSTIDNVVSTIEDLNGRKEFPKNPLSCVRGTRVCPNFERCWRNK